MSDRNLYLANWLHRAKYAGQKEPHQEEKSAKGLFICPECKTGPWHKSWGDLCPNCSGAD